MYGKPNNKPSPESPIYGSFLDHPQSSSVYGSELVATHQVSVRSGGAPDQQKKEVNHGQKGGHLEFWPNI